MNRATAAHLTGAIQLCTGWFKHNAPICARHAYSMQQRYVLEGHIFGTMLTAMKQRKRVTNPVFFVKGLGLVLAENMCPAQPQALKTFNHSQAVRKSANHTPSTQQVTITNNKGPS